jgi:hypothetical protein
MSKKGRLNVVMGPARTLAKVVKEIGLWNACLYALNELARRLVGEDVLRKYYLFAQPVPPSPLFPRNKGRQLDINVLSPEQVYCHVSNRQLSVLRDRIDQGSICIGAFRDGRLVGYLWYVQGRYREDEVRCDFCPAPEHASSWDYDVYLDPALRGSLAFVRLWDHGYEHMRARGIRWSMSRISAFNAVSVLSQERMRAVRVGSLLFFVIGRIQVMFGTVAPFLHFSFGARSRPRVRVRAPHTRRVSEIAC